MNEADLCSHRLGNGLLTTQCQGMRGLVAVQDEIGEDTLVCPLLKDRSLLST